MLMQILTQFPFINFSLSIYTPQNQKHCVDLEKINSKCKGLCIQFQYLQLLYYPRFLSHMANFSFRCLL